jgi:histidyl-tRNA synthetase
VELLRTELRKVKEQLGPDSQRRIETNPLRVLDSKVESEQGIIASLPHIADHLCEACGAHYAEVKKQLQLRGVIYRENWRLVRGLDYYMRTTFEITAKGLGSQNAVCGGGRYDGLVELLGGPPTKGIGFAIGEDRLILSLQDAGKGAVQQGRDIYIAWMGEHAYASAVRTAKFLRNAAWNCPPPSRSSARRSSAPASSTRATP